jgi:hypothetical protein
MLAVLGGPAEVRARSNPRPHRRRTGAGKGARREPRTETEANRAPKARGDSPSRPGRDTRRHRPQLQCQPQYDFAAYGVRLGERVRHLAHSALRHLFVYFCHGSDGVTSANCFPQNCLLRSAPGAAPRELAVYDHTRQASNAALLCPRCDVCLMHVVNFDVVVRAAMRLTRSTVSYTSRNRR